MTDMSPPNSPQSHDAASVDLCAHGCGYEAVVQHADGRLLCRSCYAAEVGEIAGVNPCPTCGPNEDEPTAALSVEPWHGRRVYDFETGSYLGRAEGEPYSDGIEGVIRLRQDEDGQTIKPYALCAFVKLDNPPEVSRG